MITSIRQIPVTEDSLPFARAAARCDFEGCGYVEDEYFLEGTANVYEEDENGVPKVLIPDAPYVNRMLVRRPEDPARFSGNIVVEILNPSALIDIDRMWVCDWKYFVAHGDIYIGITSKPDVLKALKTAWPERYAPLRWDNPQPGRTLPDGFKSLFPVLTEHEMGLFWDMLMDLSGLLRSNGERNPLAGYGKAHLFLTGWSQSGGYLVRFVNTFVKHMDKGSQPFFDGYLEAGAGAMPCPIHTFDTKAYDFFALPAGFHGFIPCAQPYIAINTESENEHTHWAGDVTGPGQLFRCYDFSGSSHDTKYNLLDYYEGSEDVKRLGHGPEFYGTEPYPIDYPYEFLFHAAYRNLFAWAREGVPAPASQQIQVGPDGKNPKDMHGNTVGGVRSPFLDLPTCVYSKYCTLKADPTKQRDFFGHVEPFSPEKLKALYGTLAHYRSLVAARTDALIAEGYLLACEREVIIDTAVGFAQERGL